YEDRPERNHQMKRVVQKLDVVGPAILGILIQPMYVTLKSAVRQKAQCAGNLYGIVEPLRRNVRLTENRDARIRSPVKPARHRSKRHRLMSSQHFCLLVTGWKGNENGRDQPNYDSRAQIELSLFSMEPSQGIKSSYRCNHKRAGH